MTDSDAADDLEEQPPLKEDPLVLERLRNEGEQVLAEVFAVNRERFWHLVTFRMDQRIAARVDADDVLQEAFVAASKRLQHYLRDENYTLFIWLRMIVAQTLVDVHRISYRTSVYVELVQSWWSSPFKAFQIGLTPI